MLDSKKSESEFSDLYQEIVGVAEGDVVEEEDLQKLPYLKAVVLEALRRHPTGHFVLAHKVKEEFRPERFVEACTGEGFDVTGEFSRDFQWRCCIWSTWLHEVDLTEKHDFTIVLIIT
ncbi:hypothetical protein SASPL_142123 [Salvia splendens]|uniref:Uncharacterized protein n=1 Tax=Salvia splendens TaxID=180675 RepID=A0A8X8WKD0_SALSN|nr:hypothetical protein SASPL_142123 [Salvia splendens]